MMVSKLLMLEGLNEAATPLQRARKLFDVTGDRVGCAQVDETLAQLHIACNQHLPNFRSGLRLILLKTKLEKVLCLRRR